MEEKTENFTQPSGKKFYYGWWVVVVCFLMIFITLGFGTYVRLTYLGVICEDLGFARSAYSISDSLRYIATGALSFVFGSLVLKLKPRLMVLFGFMFLILSFTIDCVATQLWHFYVAGVLLGAGYAWTGTAIIGYVIGNWFPNNKGSIMGIILAANGIGSAVFEIIMNPIVIGGDEIFNGSGFFAFLSNLTGITAGWRIGYLTGAILCVITAIIVILILRANPADKGLEPLIVNKKKNSKRKSSSWEGYELKVLLRKPYFYMSAVCVFIFGFVLQSASGIAKTHIRDVGFSEVDITLLFSFGAILLTCSKMFTGFLFDKCGIKVVVLFCGACAFISTLCLGLISSVVMAPAWIYTILHQLALPLETIVIPLLVAQMFGQKSYASILGYYIAVNMLGYATGGPVVNLFYDLTGTYNVIFIVQAVLVCATTIVSIFSITWAEKDRNKFLEIVKVDE